MPNKTFKVTVEFICHDMISAEDLEKKFNGDAMLAYKEISDDFKDSPVCFSSGDKVVKVEVL